MTDVKEGVLACLRSGVGVELNAPKLVYIKKYTPIRGDMGLRCTYRGSEKKSSADIM